VSCPTLTASTCGADLAGCRRSPSQACVFRRVLTREGKRPQPRPGIHYLRCACLPATSFVSVRSCTRGQHRRVLKKSSLQGGEEPYQNWAARSAKERS